MDNNKDTTETGQDSLGSTWRKRVDPLIDFLWDELIGDEGVAWDAKAEQWGRIIDLIRDESWH